LAGSLLVGLTYAKSIAFATGIPLIAVNHIEGHIHAVILEARQRANPVEFPALALIVSGGHTHLFEAREEGAYKLLGRTRDDAAGEAFDKVAKLLGFGYPGGPVIDQLAPYGDPNGVRFTIARMKGNTLDFSFSGLKTAVLRWVESHDLTGEIELRKLLLRTSPQPSLDEWLLKTPQPTRDLLASFQHTVIEELLRHAVSAAEQNDGVRSLIISGGVACNSGLRAALTQAATGLPVFFPTPALSTDNAVMIAAAAFPKFRRGEFASLDISAQPNLALA
jgi:N6-L-threonylcarbamoyladenine synthase